MANASLPNTQEHPLMGKGIRVILPNLLGSWQVFNGEIATVVKSKGEKQKYEVEVKGPVPAVVGKSAAVHIHSWQCASE